MTSTQDVIEDIVAPQVEHSEQQDSSSKDYNFRAMREVVKAKDELLARQRQELEELRAARQSPVRQEQEDPEDDFGLNDLDEEDALEVKKAKELFKKVPKTVEKAIERALNKQTRAQEEVKERMNASIRAAKERYADFDEVMAQDNVETIINKVPAVHQVVSLSPDPIEAAYHLIKNSAAFERKKSAKVSNMVEKAKLEDNLKKPKSPNSLPQSQSVVSGVDAAAGTFSRLTKQQQKELWSDHNKRLGKR
jgi:hypothetical protein